MTDFFANELSRKYHQSASNYYDQIVVFEIPQKIFIT